MSNFRVESDSLGDINVPASALYGAQTQRAIINFPISGLTLPKAFIQALALLKKSAAQANVELGLLDQKRAKAIINSANLIALGKHSNQFPVDVFQTGSGTSTNMNINEVIAKLSGKHVDANDHVNMGQSSNDVIPSTIHISAAIALSNQLFPALKHLHKTILNKSESVKTHIKTGRTHLMDAMPLSMGQELLGWAGQIEQGIEGLESVLKRLHRLALGGTAVGTGINTHPDFAQTFCTALNADTGLEFKPSTNYFASLAGQEVAVALSGQLKVVAVSLMKIANDLRWMNSGPLSGIGEIALEALQPGSSIMPGKVNPVIPEAVAMVSAQVIGNDTTITIAGQSGNFELNVMLPVIALNLLQSIEILANASSLLADKAIADFIVKTDNLQRSLARNPILVTALNPIIGYAKAAEIAKKAYHSGRNIIDVAEQETDLSREQLIKILDPAALTSGGIRK
ncbi:MAG: fumarate hydratase class II [Psychromonas sp.]|jgi:fumarate hydratase class II|uniref:class II fumarate hydratase n=1 Tax=Psychromonas sp. TaxID=1884585 RepID=UPI0039E615E6